MAARKAWVGYAPQRTAAFAAAKAALALPNLELTTIGATALDAVASTWPNARRRVSWSWSNGASEFQRAHPSGLSIAIWHDEVLCGLCLGRAKRGRFVALNFAEANPDPGHPLKGMVIPIALTVAEAYRLQLGAPELRLYDCDPALILRYQSFGFELAPDLGGSHDMRRRR